MEIKGKFRCPLEWNLKEWELCFIQLHPQERSKLRHAGAQVPEAGQQKGLSEQLGAAVRAGGNWSYLLTKCLKKKKKILVWDLEKVLNPCSLLPVR